MTLRFAALLAVSITAIAFGGAALAQAPDFGADTSPWANDGECDDPRFTGPGMATTTVESDRMADATDCRSAFQAGTVQLSQVQAAEPAASAVPAAPTAPAPGIKNAPATSPAAPAEPTAPPAQVATPAPAPDQTQVTPTAPLPPPAATAQVNFGDDSSQYANDRECDDRRFAGQGMATSLNWASVGRDASDCRALFEAGSVRLWSPGESQAATQCAAIDYGDNQSQYANDGECDDMRFEGLGVAGILNASEIGHDSADCSRLCAFGAISLRDY